MGMMNFGIQHVFRKNHKMRIEYYYFCHSLWVLAQTDDKFYKFIHFRFKATQSRYKFKEFCGEQEEKKKKTSSNTHHKSIVQVWIMRCNILHRHFCLLTSKSWVSTSFVSLIRTHEGSIVSLCKDILMVSINTAFSWLVMNLIIWRLIRRSFILITYSYYLLCLFVQLFIINTVAVRHSTFQ